MIFVSVLYSATILKKLITHTDTKLPKRFTPTNINFCLTFSLFVYEYQQGGKINRPS